MEPAGGGALGTKPRHHFVYHSADLSRPYRFIDTS